MPKQEGTSKHNSRQKGSDKGNTNRKKISMVQHTLSPTWRKGSNSGTQNTDDDGGG